MKIGKILPNNKVEKEFVKLGLNEGFIYKDYDAFNNKTNDVCYVPELTKTDDISEGYTYNDFIKLVKEQFNLMGIEGDVEKLAKELFNTCEWQHPETILDEWFNHND